MGPTVTCSKSRMKDGGDEVEVALDEPTRQSCSPICDQRGHRGRQSIGRQWRRRESRRPTSLARVFITPKNWRTGLDRSIVGLETTSATIVTAGTSPTAPRGVMVVLDLFGFRASGNETRTRVFQWVHDRKTRARQNNRTTYRENWWFFGENRRLARMRLDLQRTFIATI